MDRPTVDGDGEAWWAAVQNGELMVNACRSCERTSLYARPFCPYCWSEDVELRTASGRARLYTWSVVHQGAAPYVVAMVDLEEGPRLMTAVEGCDAADLRDGLELVVDFRVDDDGFAVPIFRPIDS